MCFMNNDDLSSDYNFKKHWNNAYQKSSIDNLGWYEENPTPSLELIKECNLPKDALVFNAGAGATTLISKLLALGYKNIVVNDIAETALTALKSSLTIETNFNVEFIVDDLTNPTTLLKLKNIDLWHDRAVLHFFTEKYQQEAYFKLLKKVIKVNGYVILAQFNLKGAKKCCGLNVFNYNETILQQGLGENFKLQKSFDYTYIQPSGNTREYVYTLFKRIH